MQPIIEMVNTTQHVHGKIPRRPAHKRPQMFPLASIVVPAIINAILVGFLAFLWFGTERIAVWKDIVAAEKVAQSVSITTLLIRFMVDTQASISAAMLAALILEASEGVRLPDVASMSILRYRASPWAMMQPVACSLDWTGNKLRLLRFPALLVLLLLSSISLQSSSTILLSDLQLRSLPGFTEKNHLPLDFSYNCMPSVENCRNLWFNQIPRTTAWTMNPASYPTFGEYTEPVDDSRTNQDDTGVVLRAFLPMSDAESRQNLRNHTGPALVLDARVSCQAPDLDKLTLSAPFYGNISGTVTNSTSSPRLQPIIPTSFLCVFAGPGQRSICQIGVNVAYLYIGSLDSQFQRPNETYGTAFLIIDPSGDYSSQSNISTSALTSTNATTSTRGSWTDVSHPSANSTLSLSLCFAPWDAARLSINMHSSQNRTEPSPHWTAPTDTESVGSFNMDPVLHQLGLHSEPNDSSFWQSTFEGRGILALDRPTSLAPPAHSLPPFQRPFVQADMSSAGGGSSGISVPLAGNRSTLLSGHTLDAVLNNFTYTPDNLLAADPAVASLFNAAFRATNASAARALSAVITVLSATAYYGQLPAFDFVPERGVEQVYFRTVQMPVRASGFAALVWLLAAHTVLVSVIMVIFQRRSTASLLNEAWACVAQLHAVVADVCRRDDGSERAGARGIGASMVGNMTDEEVEREFESHGRGKTRVRIVGSGETYVGGQERQ